ncbi:MAG: hypothetical protein HS102_18375 [Planctomycetia bacterium]|nr:hypothetical protein [Planctomycetia bacterium]
MSSQINPTNYRLVVWILIAVLLILGSLFVAVGIVLKSFRSETVETWKRVQIGDTEDAVRTALGKPFREYSAEKASQQYYVHGYHHKERDISHRVLIYMGADMVLYVWIDKSGHVEDLFQGGS